MRFYFILDIQRLQSFHFYASLKLLAGSPLDPVPVILYKAPLSGGGGVRPLYSNEADVTYNSSRFGPPNETDVTYSTYIKTMIVLTSVQY